MKKLLKVLIGIAAVFAALVGAIFYFTAGMVSTASSFFDAVKKQDMSAARAYLSEDFKANTDEVALRAFLSDSALLQFNAAHWSSRAINGGRGTLEGSITTASGGTIPLTITFVKENSQWKIYSIQKPTAGLLSQSTSPSMPSVPDQVSLVKGSIHDFAVSVNEKSMEHFHSTISQLWKKQITTEQLDKAFGSVYGVNLLGLDEITPKLDPVQKLGDNGVLTITGDYPTKPKLLHFEQKYVYEGVGWKLVGFTVNAE